MLHSIAGEAGGAADAELAFDVVAVRLHRTDGDAECCGDLFVRFSLGQFQQYRLLAVGQRFAPVRDFWGERSACSGAEVLLPPHDRINRSADFLGGHVLQDIPLRPVVERG